MTQAILNWLYNLPLSQTIRTSAGLLLAIRYLHFLAVMFVVVSISRVDLRLMGVAHKRTPVTELLADFLPWTWRSFVIAALTGILLFMSKAPSFYNNEAFRLKVLFIGFAGLNMVVFHAFTYRGVALLDDNVPTVFAAKVAGALSLTLWIAAAVFGVRVLYTVGH
jgi:hypothetical protein